ncbi:MAG: hypothetical protein II938_03950 [Alphaproteobacteria bacterium]|nr:hypothetical protein [Alphaproteobacteria bacterium]
MIFTLLIGLIAGVAMVIYRGLYFGPWNAALNTIGACLAAAIICYILLQILANIGGFFLKILFVVIITVLILFGGTKIWNTYNPDHPINFPPSAVTDKVNGLTSRIR